MEVLMHTRPAPRLLRVLAPVLVAVALLAVLLAARQAPTPTPTSIPSPPATMLRPPAYVFVPAGPPPTTTIR
jgi:hypothetical protein